MKIKHPMTMSLQGASALLFILILIFNGCGEQISQPLKPPLKPQAGKASEQPAVVSASVPVENGMEDTDITYKYVTAGRRDPFKSLLLGLKEKRSTGLTPLQQRSLGELRVIGIIWGTQGYIAMIETPDGKGFLIKEGALVGPDGGSVKKITEDSIIIEEIYTDYYGMKRSKQTVLRLHAKEEGGG